MDREAKRAAVERLHEVFRGATHAVLVDFRGMKVGATTELRRRVRATAARYEVVKNRLASRASADTVLGGLAPHMRGPTAVITGSGDPIALARMLRDFHRDHPALRLKAGWVEGQTLTADDLVRVANLPSRPEMIARFSGALVAPVSRFCAALQAPLRRFAAAVDAIARKRS